MTTPRLHALLEQIHFRDWTPAYTLAEGGFYLSWTKSEFCEFVGFEADDKKVVSTMFQLALYQTQVEAVADFRFGSGKGEVAYTHE